MIDKFNNKKKETAVGVVILWVLIICQCFIISSFSGNTASVSTEKSSVIVEKIIEVIETIFNRKTTEEFFEIVQFFVRKLAHFVNFFILGFLIAFCSFKLEKKCLVRSFFAVLLSGFLCAVIDEMHQLFVAGRSGEIRDVCIDFLGVFVGYTVFLFAKVVFYVEKK